MRSGTPLHPVKHKVNICTATTRTPLPLCTCRHLRSSTSTAHPPRPSTHFHSPGSWDHYSSWPNLRLAFVAALPFNSASDQQGMHVCVCMRERTRARNADACMRVRADALPPPPMLCGLCPRAHPHASLPLSALTISDVPRMELARGAAETRSRVVFIRAGRAVKADDPGVAREDRGDCSELQRYDEPPGAPVVSSPGAAGRGPAGVRATASAAPHAPSASHFPPAPVCARGELHRERARAQARALWTHGHITGTWRVNPDYPSEFEVLMQRVFAALTSCCNRSTVAPVFFFGSLLFWGFTPGGS